MRMLEARCSSTLKSLDCVYNNNMPPNYYSEFFAKFRNLTKLNVYASMVDDIAFQAIGKNCTKLIELNAGSTWITNIGVKHLCLDDVAVVIPGMPASYRLPNLAILDLSDTRVTPQGLSLFLATHPNLVKLENKENFHSFKLVQSQQFTAACSRSPAAEAPQQSFRLKSLSTIDVSLTPEDFEFAIDSCPNLESMTITSAGLGNENLYKLMTLTKLTHLHLGNKNCQSFNFYEGVAPVLDVVGHGLKKLVLEEFTEVDVSLIGVKCSDLEHLALSGTLTYAPINSLNPTYFTKMTSLELWNKIGQEHEYAVATTTIRQLLYKAPLTYLLLQRIGNLTDELVASILEVNRMLDLRNVVIDYCHNVTVATMWAFLLQPNNLGVMRSWHCKGVTMEDKLAVKKVIQDENLMLYWEWFPYNEYEELLEAGLIPEDDDDEEADDDD